MANYFSSMFDMLQNSLGMAYVDGAFKILLPGRAKT